MASCNRRCDGVFTLIGTCAETNPTDNYCVPQLNFNLPIDRVKFGSIDNASTSDVAYEDFSAITTNVEQDKTYDLQIDAETFDANSEQAITVYVDWNQDGFLGDEGEIYQIGMISEATQNTITVPLQIPLTAKTGPVRMRIISNVYEYADFACSVFDQGQAEDYTLNVLKKQLSVSQGDNKSKTIIYPNPVKSNLSIKSDSELVKSEIFDLSGRKVMESTTKEADLSKLSTGQYLIKMTFKNGIVETQKLIKK